MIPTSQADSSPRFLLRKVVCLNPELEDELVIGNHTIKEDYLVIMVDVGLGHVYMINMDKRAKFPIRVPYDQLLQHIGEESVLLADMSIDPKLMCDEDLLPDGFKKKANKRLQDIMPLTLDVESVLRNGYGDKTFQKVAEQARKEKQYIYDTFYSYLRHAGIKNCLGMPQGNNANHIPKKKSITGKTRKTQ